MWNLNSILGFTNTAADDLNSLEPLSLSLIGKLDFQMSEGWNKQAIVWSAWRLHAKSVFLRWEKLHLAFKEEREEQDISILCKLIED